MSFNYYYIIRTDDFFASAGGSQGAIITRDNYEMYFVMYVDNELSAADRKAVERFVQQNPDLEEEMVMLQQSVLRADDNIIFEQKELLFKDAAAALLINELNYEEYFVLYGDDELTNEEKDKVEQFVYKHPQYQAEFELIQQVKLVPDKALTFPDKTYLYRTEEDDSRVIAFPWWRLSAAAIALLVIGSLAWYISAQHTGTDVAGRFPERSGNEKNTQPPVVHNNKDNDTAPVKDAVADNSNAVIKTPQAVPPVAAANQTDNTTAQNKLKKNIPKESNIQQPTYVKQASKQPETPAGGEEKTFAPKPVYAVLNNTNETPVVKSGLIKRTINEPLAVNTVAEKPGDENDQSQQAILTASINKTPLRGFFRKVSRVVDKVTNSDDNGKGAIRIANLEFALK
ncbi:hypothetical protein A3860_01045 [Niastella vici]|uniref:Uncharacterized protein n=1 Tax=Niastella vici TaxID=1703345 RepID=A0A1V9G930_9BACT|nr:hypothetical protein [Niastella vici]OQP66976.1 hypothetical protein A3860_01045 [Niastella vici]